MTPLTNLNSSSATLTSFGAVNSRSSLLSGLDSSSSASFFSSPPSYTFLTFRTRGTSTITKVPASYFASRTWISCSFSPSSSLSSSEEESNSSSEDVSSSSFRFFFLTFFFFRFLARSFACFFRNRFCSSLSASFFSASSMTGKHAVSIAKSSCDSFTLQFFGIFVPSLFAHRLYRSSTCCLKVSIFFHSPQLVPPFKSMVCASAHI
mmetsp:Transcript_3841/g.4422  ORF Transcript_3841/g.4422 Transcript_3841/m.4422 type:complete len:207 (+) Transcript_3841:542-1162(+)